jgi:transposase-like protein
VSGRDEFWRSEVRKPFDKAPFQLTIEQLHPCTPTSMTEKQDPRSRLVAGRKRDGRRKFNDDAVQELVVMCLRPGVSIARAAMDHDVNPNQLRRWITHYQQSQSLLTSGGADPMVIDDAPIEVPAPTSLNPMTAWHNSGVCAGCFCATNSIAGGSAKFGFPRFPGVGGGACVTRTATERSGVRLWRCNTCTIILFNPTA